MSGQVPETAKFGAPGGVLSLSPDDGGREVRRLSGLDRLRGLAVVLMVVDHLLVAFPVSELVVVRSSLTRASLPLFCLVAGSLIYRRRSAARLWRVAGAGLVATVPGVVVGIGQPDVLLVLAAALAVASWASCRPTLVYVGVLSAAVLQPVTWPLELAGGYQPGVVLALVLVGQLVQPIDLEELGRRLPAQLRAVGRYPLSIYVGHLVVLAIVKGVGS